jgi:hypothetical protein
VTAYIAAIALAGALVAWWPGSLLSGIVFMGKNIRALNTDYARADAILTWACCLDVPDKVTINQASRVVIAYIEARPARMHEPFNELALEALRDAWPCK